VSCVCISSSIKKETESNIVKAELPSGPGTEAEAETGTDGVLIVVDNLRAGGSGDPLIPEQVDIRTECGSHWKKSN